MNLRLEQGVDERKPLVSLFVSQGQAPEWIAWTPLGPYDSSSRDAEGFLGWHFNPSKLGEPVRFAVAEAYWERLHKPGLLKPLLAHANLTDALRELDKPVSVPRATIFCSVDAASPGAIRRRHSGAYPRAPPHMTLRFPNPGALDRQKRSRVGHLAYQRWRTAADPTGKCIGRKLRPSRSIFLPEDFIECKSACGRAKQSHRKLRGRGASLSAAATQNSIGRSGRSPHVIREAQFHLKANIEPGSANPKVIVQFRKGQAEPQGKGPHIDEIINLEPGENVLELSRDERRHSAGHEEFETDRRTVVIVFQPKDAPQIALASLAVHGNSIEVVPGRPTTVAAGKVPSRARLSRLSR